MMTYYTHAFCVEEKVYSILSPVTARIAASAARHHPVSSSMEINQSRKTRTTSRASTNYRINYILLEMRYMSGIGNNK